MSFLTQLKIDYKKFPIFIKYDTSTFDVEPFFENIHTIDLSECKQNSEKLEKIDKPAIFFLSHKDKLLIDEMYNIQKKFKHECIIILDDVRLFDKGNEVCIFGDRIEYMYCYIDRMIFHIKPRPTYRVSLSGGLGNRMFVFASIYGLSKKDFNNFDIVCGQSICKEHENDYKWLNDILTDFFSKEDKHFYNYTQPCSEWINVAVNTDNFSNKDTIFSGALQCELNFKHVSDDIRKIFKIDEKTSSEILEFEKNNSIDLNDCTIIHVRLGDYIHTPLLGFPLGNY
jgi:hypothetical protein